MIDPELLLEAGAKKIQLSKGEWIFRQGDRAYFYFQVISGQIKMSNFSENGQEFVQGLFSAGQSFGEPPLFVDVTYPASAIATRDSVVIKLTKDHFMELLMAQPEVSLKISENLAKRLHYKAVMASEISSQDPAHRILTLLEYLKKEIHTDTESSYEVKLTRQQIADLTGLRVETVIRAIKKMDQNGVLQVQDRKVFL